MRNFSCYFTKNTFYHRQFPSVLKSLLTLKRGICSGVSFQYSCEWYIGQVKLLERNYAKQVFLVIFQDFETLSEKYMKVLVLETCRF